jgi:hypothetical protein
MTSRRVGDLSGLALGLADANDCVVPPRTRHALRSGQLADLLPDLDGAGVPGGGRERRRVRGRGFVGLLAGAVGLRLAGAGAVPGPSPATRAVADGHLPVADRAAGGSGHAWPGVS